MKISTKCHIETLFELLEVISITGTLALIADSIWIIGDIIASEYTRPLLYIIACILIPSACVATVAVYKYHMQLHKKKLQDLYIKKLELQAYKNRYLAKIHH